MLEAINITMPDVPTKVERLRIGHITDLHVRQKQRRHTRIIDALSHRPPDMLVLTGDYMDKPGDEAPAMDVLRAICNAIKPRLGSFGVFGNHDSGDLREQCEELPIKWLRDDCHSHEDVPIDVLGFDSDPNLRGDCISALNNLTNPGPDRFRLLLSHYPNQILTASDMNVHLMIAGHTHGGQCRLPGGKPLYNSTDMPLNLTSGILRHRSTLCVVSRGLGEANIQFRFMCPPQLPIYSLHRGPLLGQKSESVVNIKPW